MEGYLRIFEVLLRLSVLYSAVWLKVSGEKQESILMTPNGRLSCTRGDGCVLNSTGNLDFLVIGDIGGLPIYPYYSYAQNQVAHAMNNVVRDETLRFVVNLGDNFYFNGVENIFDSRFENSFESVYEAPNLRVPWYTIAGNHDHLGNVTAQLIHTNFSSKWTFPSLFYKVKYSFGDQRSSRSERTTVEMLFIDTIVLCGNTVDVQGESLLSWLFAKKKTPNGPEPEYIQLAKEQWEWIEETLRTSTADYLFVNGHYPVYSVSEHGPFKCLIDKLDPMLRKYNVNAYFSGHDHNLQHIRINQTDEEGAPSSMDYFVCGASSRTDRSAKHKNDVPEGSLLYRYPTGWNPFSQIGFSNGGFIHGELRPESATIRFYTGKEEVKYESTLYPRRVRQRK